MQGSPEQVVLRGRAADVDDARLPEILAEHVDHPLTHLIVEAVEHFVDEHPGRPVQQGARECHALLLIVVQVAIPALGRIEERNQARQIEPGQRRLERFEVEAVDRRGIGEHFAQRARRQIRRARQI